MSVRYISEDKKLIAQPVSVFRKINANLKKKIRKEERRRDTILKLTLEAEQLNAKLTELYSDSAHPANYVTHNGPGPVREGGYVPRRD